MNEIKLTCHGAAQEVGRSHIIVDSADKIALDCGVKLTPHETEYPLPLNTNLSAAIISHAHLDHSGNLPHLFMQSEFRSYMTPPTLDLSKMLWFDTLKIAGLEGMDANFTREEIATTEESTYKVGYNRNIKITDKTSMQFYDAGHILGSAITKLNLGNKTLVYTGDYKKLDTRLHKGADLKGVKKCDYLIIESTYGDRNHEKRKEVEKHFVEDVQDTIDRGGHALVPAFAVGRSQEIIDILNEYNVNAEVYFDGMGQKAARIYLRYPKYLKDYPFLKKALESVRWIKTIAMRKKALKQPSVIVTTAGMLQGGPVYEYLPDLYKDKNSRIMLTGYQVIDTPGRILQEKGKIALSGINVDVKMQIGKYDFSAHPGKKELLETIEMLNPEKVICVHGDKEVMKVFKNSIKAKGFDAIVPKLGEEITL